MNKYGIPILEEMAEEDMVTVAGTDANQAPTVGLPLRTTKQYSTFAVRPTQRKRSAAVSLELSLEKAHHKLSYL
ncbi:hypothetical protein [Bradyrhizobium sp. USDA 3240]